jgi:hypothetical protein
MPFLLVVGGRYDPLSSERRYEAGDFQNQDQALAAARKIIQRSLLECWREGMSTQTLFESYRASGEFPFMLSREEKKPLGFDPLAFALVEAVRICEGERDGGR